MRRGFVLLLAFPLVLARCGADSSTGDEGDGDGDSSTGGMGNGGTRGGGAGSAARGGSSGTNGEAGAAGEGQPTGGTNGTGGAGGAGGAAGAGAGTAGTGGCDDRPVDVLILLDRSASMRDPPELPGGLEGTMPKWELTLPPLLDALSTTAPIRWGLKTFSDGGVNDFACAATEVSVGLDVPVEDDNVEAVREAILATTPDGPSTPTGDAVRLAAADLLADGSDNPKFILLVTDGQPSCINVTPTSDGIEGQEEARPYAVQALGDVRAAGVETFLVGIEGSLERAVQTLSEMAVAGGRPAPEVNPLEPLYYLALDSASVTEAMDSVIRSAVLCSAPPPASLMLPYADDFETSSAADWRFIQIPWSVSDDSGNNVLLLTSTGDSYTTWAIGGDRNWTDVRVEMRVKFVSGDAMILLSPRFRDLDNYAFVEYEASDRPKLRRRLQGSTADIITSEPTLTFAPGQWHTVAVTLSGSNATLEFDGAVLGMGTDATPVPSGGIGIAVENGIVAIDDVRVTAP